MEFDYPSYEFGYRRESRCEVQQKISFRAPEKCHEEARWMVEVVR